MNIQQIDLAIDYEKLQLTKPIENPKFIGYILENHKEYCENRKRPAVIICPGGGYEFTSQREATPIAMEYVAKGISAFVLHYSCAPVQFPTSLVEVAKAVAMVRENAQQWNIDPDKIVVTGFSAGGHLAASLGVFWNHEVLKEKGFCDDMHKPNGLVQNYPVISSGVQAHVDSFHNLLGDKYGELLEFVSLENQVTNDLPPVFLWHTYDDTVVPVENSLLFAQQAITHETLTEVHIYPKGIHGISLANNLVITDEYIVKNLDSWINFAVAFIYNI